MKKIIPHRVSAYSIVLAALLAWLPQAQAQPLVLIATELTGPQGLALGDVDGDGYPDLVVATRSGPNRLYLGRGEEGEFGAGVDIDTDALETTSLALGDVDGDGDLDLVTGNWGAVNRLYLNVGLCPEEEVSEVSCTRQSVFAEGLDLSPDIRNTHAIALARIDANETLDLVVINEGETSRIYFNQGEGRFLRSQSRDISADVATSRALALGDLDDDGDLDLVIANSDQSNRVYLNDGEGNFSGTAIGTLVQVSRDVELRDVDGDGDLDLLVANEGASNRLHLNGGSGLFDDGVELGGDVDATMALVSGDLDGDGDIDLIAGNVDGPDRFYLNLGRQQGGGEGTFDGGHSLLIDNGDVSALLLYDFAGNGSPDLLAATQTGTVSLFRNSSLNLYGNGYGGVASRDIGSEAEESLAAAVADLDGDGDLDYVVGNHHGAPNRIYLNQGDGSFAMAGTFGIAAESTQALRLADLDGDGDVDIVSGNWVAPNRVYLNQGDGNFGSGSDLSSDADQTTSLALADLNQDQIIDLVVGNWGQKNRLYLGLGDGSFAAGIDISDDDHFTQAMVLGDVDGDGRIDVVAVNGAQRERNRLYINVEEVDDNGNGTGGIVFTDRQGQAVGENLPEVDDESYAAALADLDGDGDLDYIDGSSGLSRYYLNDGNGLYGDGKGGGVGFVLNPGQPHSVFGLDLGDVDGDGDVDLVMATGHINRLYLNQGGLQGGRQGHFDHGSDLNADVSGTYAIALADMDGDGRLDVITTNSAQTNRYYPSLLGKRVLRVAPGVNNPVVTESDAPVFLGIGCLGVNSGGASIDYAIELGSEADSAAADDLALVSGRLTWPDGVCEAKQIELSLTFDGVLEGPESFYLVLKNPQGFENGGEIPLQRYYKVVLEDGVPTDVVAPETAVTPSTPTDPGGGGGGILAWWLPVAACGFRILRRRR